jgi:hypothetical protein
MSELIANKLYELHDSPAKAIKYFRTRDSPQDPGSVWIEIERDADYFRIGPVLTMSLRGNGMGFWGDEVICRVDVESEQSTEAHFYTGQNGTCQKITIELNSGSELVIFISPQSPCLVDITPKIPGQAHSLPT